MTSEIALPTYGRIVRQESEHGASGHPHTKQTRTIETVNNGVVSPQASDYQDGYFHGQIDSRPYQEEGKADRDNNTLVVGLVVSFIFMPLLSLVASNLFPFQGTQSNTSTSTVDITPLIIPMQ